MKPIKILFISFFTILASCESNLPTKPTSFFVFNNCQNSIKVVSTVITQSQILGPQKVTITDVINPNDKFLLRKIDATEKVKISSVFYEIKILKDDTESSKNYLDDILWKKMSNTEFLLTVESSFFD